MMSSQEELEAAVENVLRKDRDIPSFEHPFRFNTTGLVEEGIAPSRQHFDFAWPQFKVCLEVEGGIFKGQKGGRHNRPMGFHADTEKYNEASMRGWLVLRVTTLHVNSNTAYIQEIVKRALRVRGAKIQSRTDRVKGLFEDG